VRLARLSDANYLRRDLIYPSAWHRCFGHPPGVHCSYPGLLCLQWSGAPGKVLNFGPRSVSYCRMVSYSAREAADCPCVLAVEGHCTCVLSVRRFAAFGSRSLGSSHVVDACAGGQYPSAPPHNYRGTAERCKFNQDFFMIPERWPLPRFACKDAVSNQESPRVLNSGAGKRWFWNSRKQSWKNTGSCFACLRICFISKVCPTNFEG
jgi:hypothetical protein